ncbi:PDR/VanB family oxidoreductase [Nocardia bovistercoris]|nr:PDR/VanB family oxidoreductase [Nocardia bovistercoris]
MERLSRVGVELTLRVAQRRQEADGVVSLTLQALDTESLPGWDAGSHIDVVVGDGTTRQYSLCGDPTRHDSWRIAVLREESGRGGSRWVHDTVREGDSLRVRGPRNHFRLEPAPRYLFIGGGIGVTPLLPMIAAAEAAGAEWRLAYGGRSSSSMAFLTELECFGERVVFYPHNETGKLDLDRLLATPSRDTLVYCCGPEALLEAVEQKTGHWPAGSLHVERFSARSDTAVAVESDHAFEVELSRSGTVVQVPADRTVLSVLEEVDADVVSSCAEGTCGSCETIVLAGRPDHRDSVLTDAERAAGDRMMVCVSRCLGSRLVLDL